MLRLDVDAYFIKGAYYSVTGELTEQILGNAEDLLARVNGLLEKIQHIEAARAPKINSGWRPAFYNSTVPGAAVKSKHITGEAVDLADPDGELDEFLFANQQYLIDAGLWLEHPLASKGWTHLQSVPPRSGNRVFFP